jgi:hypothetical protein
MAFTQRTSIKRHMLIHEGIRPYQCTLCSQWFRAKDHLVTHRRLVHKRTSPLPDKREWAESEQESETSSIAETVLGPGTSFAECSKGLAQFKLEEADSGGVVVVNGNLADKEEQDLLSDVGSERGIDRPAHRNIAELANRNAMEYPANRSMIELPVNRDMTELPVSRTLTELAANRSVAEAAQAAQAKGMSESGSGCERRRVVVNNDGLEYVFVLSPVERYGQPYQYQPPPH